MPAGPPPTTSRRRGAGAVGHGTVDLVAGVRVHRAPEGQPFDVPAADALVAADARPDVGRPALARLDQQVAVGDVRAGHADDVRVPGREHPLGDVRAR